MSVKRYMAVDLTILAILMCLLEGLIAFGVGLFPGEVYSLSVVLPITLIVIMRWGAYGLIHAVLGGALYAMLYGGIPSVLVYAAGNAGVALCLLLTKFVSREKIRASLGLTFIYCVLGWLGVNLGRSLFMMDYARQFFAADLLNLIATLIIIAVAGRQNGVFEWQHSFLIRQREEEKLKSEA